MRNFISLSESLNDFVLISSIEDSDIRRACCHAFNELAEQQRGFPERMGGASDENENLTNATGLFTHGTEHLGDLTHRMTEKYATGSEGDKGYGYGFVNEKVSRALTYMRNEYGFEREIREQTQRNYEYRKSVNPKMDITFEKWWTDLEEAGIRYSEAHQKLTVYNEAQWIARQSAIAFGYMDFGQSHEMLERLETNLISRDQWVGYAGMVRIRNGIPQPFEIGIRNFD